MATVDVALLNQQGYVFLAANKSEVTHSVVANVMTGLILYNPVGSGVILQLIDWNFSWTTVDVTLVGNLTLAGLTEQFVIPTSVSTTSINTMAADGTKRPSKAYAWDGATFPLAPVYLRYTGGSSFSAAGANSNPYLVDDPTDGSICVQPGAAIMTAGVTDTVLGMASFVWTEVAP